MDNLTLSCSPHKTKVGTVISSSTFWRRYLWSGWARSSKTEINQSHNRTKEIIECVYGSHVGVRNNAIFLHDKKTYFPAAINTLYTPGKPMDNHTTKTWLPLALQPLYLECNIFPFQNKCPLKSLENKIIVCVEHEIILPLTHTQYYQAKK